MLRTKLELSDLALKYKLALKAIIDSDRFILTYTVNGKVQIGDKEYRGTYNDISKGLTEYVLASFPNLKDEVNNFRVSYPEYRELLDDMIISLNKHHIKTPEDYFNE